MCWVLSGLKDLDKRVIHVKNTWARRCDKTLFIGAQAHKTFPVIFWKKALTLMSARQVIANPQPFFEFRTTHTSPLLSNRTISQRPLLRVHILQQINPWLGSVLGSTAKAYSSCVYTFAFEHTLHSVSGGDM